MGWRAWRQRRYRAACGRRARQVCVAFIRAVLAVLLRMPRLVSSALAVPLNLAAWSSA
jgi:hypothetical protein